MTNYNSYVIDITDMYETVNTGQRNVVVNHKQSVTRAGNLEIQVYRAHEVEEGTVLMEPNTAYSVPTNIEMQSYGAYEVEKKNNIL